MFTTRPGAGSRIPILAPLRQQVTLGPLTTAPTGPTQRQLPGQPSGASTQESSPELGACHPAFLPVSLPHRLLLLRLADVPHVVQWEEQKVPVGGKPRQGEGSIELPEGQLGELRGARPRGAHAQHHGHAPENLPELRPGASPAVRARPAAGLRPRRRLGLRRARGIPGALLPWGKRRGWLTGGPPHLPLAAPDQGGSRSEKAPDPTAAVTVSHPGEGVRGCGGSFLKQNLNRSQFSLVLLSSGILTLQVWSMGELHRRPPLACWKRSISGPTPEAQKPKPHFNRRSARTSVFGKHFSHTHRLKSFHPGLCQLTCPAVL